ncbi:hypothetical protein J1N35_029633 [Gossypium stocksii]|uniref:Uncharacterized protein n=1 Tax=Gossypium stocksii TaxID=47602 RepID=A0A9D3UYA9_9ROSI|nr:hypothetical protein J1N35_029633 [Gossypium stocksii]
MRAHQRPTETRHRAKISGARRGGIPHDAERYARAGVALETPLRRWGVWLLIGFHLVD